MVPFASIDIGSNTFRLLIGGFENNRIIEIHSDRKITRLGNKVDQTGMLQANNIEDSVKALKEFSDVISYHGVKQVRAVATSALREASNSTSFIERILAETGIAIEVISGKREAELTLKGVLLSLSEIRTSKGEKPYSFLIIDIGGGSTEWILYRDNSLIDMKSIPLGVIKMTQKFIQSDPISEHDLNALINEMISSLGAHEKDIMPFINQKSVLIGTGGTFSTIASIDLGLETYSRDKIHLHTLSLARLNDMNSELLSLPLEQRKKVRGLEPERADLIIPGVVFTMNIMNFFGFHDLVISEYGLLEGMLIEIQGEK